MRRSQEDLDMAGERKAVYEETRQHRLTASQEKAAAESKLKQEQREAFDARQKSRTEWEDQEKARISTYRNESLGHPTLGSPLPPWDGLHEHSAVPVNHLSQPVQWSYTTVKKSPDAMASAASAMEAKDALLALPHNVSLDELNSYIKNISSNSADLTRKAAKVRRERDELAAAAAAAEKKEHEEAVLAMRAAEKAKADAARDAAISRSKQIKKEMAAETLKQANTKMEKDKVRYGKAVAQRGENVRSLLYDMKLRDEDEIANERREGSSMAKGGKDELLKSKSDV